MSKWTWRGILSALLVVGLVAGMAPAEAGNGAPSGSHYNLNVIGVEKGHSNSLDANQRHTMFVPLGKNGTASCDIGLTEGPFQVLDWSCLDGDRAEFQLPAPADADANGKLEYSVWVRALGKPGGSADMTTCYTDGTGTWCNAGDLVVPISRSTGKSRFDDVSKELLQVCADDPTTDAVDLELRPLFADGFSDYFWHYENHGLRLAQFRFYPEQTTPEGGDCEGQRGPHPSH